MKLSLHAKAAIFDFACSIEFREALIHQDPKVKLHNYARRTTVFIFAALWATNVAIGDDLAKRVTEAPEELLASLAASLQTVNTDAANATFNELAVLCGDRNQDGPEKMTRREKLKYRLRILDLIGLNIDERAARKFDINPAATVAAAPPDEKVDPAVKAERERYVTEHQGRANQSRLNASLKRFKRQWIENLKFFVGRYYDDSPASIVEIKEVLHEAITVEKTKNEIGQTLKLLDPPS